MTGESACASPENFDPEIGRRIARENAAQKIWPLLGFRLRDKLATGDEDDFLTGKTSCNMSDEGACEACQ